ncbi:MAG TPA: ribosome assembly cofactor RimP [Bacteroidales bacterium]|nr:ribosome assembly cofactor RimP [Bacteroidales bacterium]
MIDNKLLGNIISEKLESSPLFLVEFASDHENNIRVIIDGDHGVTIDDCVGLSRHIENRLQHETEQFSLQVSSPGVGQPLIMARQYNKNVGRKLKITLNDNTVLTATLIATDAQSITVLPDTKGKKQTDTVTTQIAHATIRKSIVLVSFK